MNDNPILKAIANCNPNLPLEPHDPKFVDLDDIRGFALRKRILRLVQAAETDRQFAKIAVAGHRGAGKSTELNRTQEELKQNAYITLWASVNENLDPRDISFSDVMRLIVQLIDDRFGQEAAANPPVKEAFRVVGEWFKEVTKKFQQKIQYAKDLGLRARVGGAAGADVSFGLPKFKTELGELSAAISVVRQSEDSESTEIKETLERYNNQLVENVNSLLHAVTQHCCAGSKLVFILDNVDKYEPATVNQAFLRHADLFHQLESHLIFTLQSSLLYKPVDNAVEQSFRTETLPMLPVFEPRSRRLNTPVVAKIREAVYKRVPTELFEGGDDAVNEIILASGGCWRDLLRLLQEALLGADANIGADDIRKARQRVALSYQRLLRSGNDLTLLAEAHLRHVILSDDATQFLLHHLCLLFYNGEGWYDVHPLLDTYVPLQEAIQSARRVNR